ncbi:MAG: phosphatase PAP2 family protein [Candidatus Delongbacteria bacterium]|nr:phosphatase PAP2 family protein [Candidatus Delongbacteria bacterium]
MQFLYEFDEKSLFFINRTVRNDVLDIIFVFFSDRMSLLVLVPVLAFIGFTLKKQGNGKLRKLIVISIMAIIAASLSDIVTSRVIKPIFARPRPCQVLEGLFFYKVKSGIWVLTDGISSYKSSFSFVSSHASNSISAAVVFGYFYKKLIPALILAVAIIGLSRPYLGVHYPSDIISGWITGVLTASIVILLFKKMRNKYEYLRI